MNKNEKINLTLSNKNVSEINTFMTMLDETLKVGRKVNKNLTYKKNLRNCLTVLFSTEFQPKISEELN